MRAFCLPALFPVLLFAMLSLGAPRAEAADVVITASTVSSLTPGRLLKPDAEIDVPAGGSVTLFAGKTPVEVKGPFKGAVSAAVGASAGGASVVSALTSRRKRVRGLAASRSLGGAGAENVAAMLHLMADQTWCVAGAAPSLYLRPAKRDRLVIMTGPGGAHEMLWPAGEAVLGWPAGAPFEAGARYALSVDDIAAPFDLVLVAGGAGGGDGARLEGFLNAGCAAQADALMTSLAGG